MQENLLGSQRLSFLRGGGEMGELTRNFDWSKTAIGTPDGWPQSLRSTLSILLNSKFPMFLFWGPEHLCFYNNAYRPSLGNNGKHPGILGVPGKEAWPEIWNFLKPMIQNVLAGGEATWFEDQLVPIYRNGQMEDVYWTFSYSPVSDETGDPAGVFVTCTETTKAITSFQRMQESEARFRLIVEKAISPVFILKGEDMVLEMANQPLFDVWGVGTEAIGKTFLEILPEMKDQPFLDWMRKVYRTGEAFSESEIPAHFVRKNGEIDTRYWNFIYQAYREKDGTISGVLAQATEVTDQVLARKAVEESEAQFRTLIEEAPVATCLYVGRDLKIDVINEAMIAYMGKGRSVIGKPMAEALPELNDQPFLQILDDVYTSGKTFQTTSAPAQLQINGVMETHYFDYTFKPLKNAAGEVYGIINMGVKVTEQVLAKKILEQSEQDLRSLVLQAPTGICVINAATLVTEIVNDTYVEIAGKPYDAIIGRYFWDIFPEAAPYYETALQGVIDSGKAFHAIEVPLMLIRHGKEEDLYVTFVYEPMKDTSGKVKKVVVWALENTPQVTARQKIEQVVTQRTAELAEANLLLKQNNRELEQFAYIASHDLQEPLRKVSTFTEMLKTHLGEVDEKSATFFSKITTASQRMMQLIRDVLDFSQLSNQRPVFERVDIVAVIQNLTSDFELVIEQKGAVIEYGDLPVLSAIPLQMRQLFGNLLSNALKFTKEGVPPVISISSASLTDEEKATHKDLLADVDYCLITVTDNGIGFSQEHAEKIFSIFQRLHGKSEFAGTGIGLALCKKIVQNHHGEIRASSEPGSGAVFHIILPCPKEAKSNGQ